VEKIRRVVRHFNQRKIKRMGEVYADPIGKRVWRFLRFLDGHNDVDAMFEVVVERRIDLTRGDIRRLAEIHGGKTIVTVENNYRYGKTIVTVENNYRYIFSILLVGRPQEEASAPQDAEAPAAQDAEAPAAVEAEVPDSLSDNPSDQSSGETINFFRELTLNKLTAFE
jgi:hypothetical protein